MADKFKPLPAWKQRAKRTAAWWRRTKYKRKEAARSFKAWASRALILAVSVLGAILIASGVYQVYAPAGYMVGGLLCWVLLWSNEADGRRR